MNLCKFQQLNHGNIIKIDDKMLINYVKINLFTHNSKKQILFLQTLYRRGNEKNQLM